MSVHWKKKSLKSFQRIYLSPVTNLNWPQHSYTQQKSVRLVIMLNTAKKHKLIKSLMQWVQI